MNRNTLAPNKKTPDAESRAGRSHLLLDQTGVSRQDVVKDRANVRDSDKFNLISIHSDVYASETFLALARMNIKPYFNPLPCDRRPQKNPLRSRARAR